jgi:peptidoglycan/xylan/chitin deacetylase (PgdA/CDA1 family)
MNKITFVLDDGYEAEYIYAFPVFYQHGAVACSAVTSDFIGKKKIGTDEPYSTREQLLDLQDSGWEILSHGKEHKELAKLNIYEAEREIKNSKEDLTSMGFNVNNFIYPCHSINDNVRYMVSQHYRAARGSVGVNDAHTDKFNLKGIMIDDHTDIARYKEYVNTEKDKWLIFYCHICTSKYIHSTVDERIHTIDQLLTHIKKTDSQIVTFNGAL